jgi:hypothetical protein
VKYEELPMIQCEYPGQIINDNGISRREGL